MKVMILGNGGREHVMARMLSKSLCVNEVFVAPGNGGTALEFENVNIPIRYPFKELIDFAKEKSIELVVVGPEAYLVAGVVDTLSQIGIPTFGPVKAAARLEGSKHFAKKIMKENNIPTAPYGVFTTLEEAKDYIKIKEAPYVLKADGLAAGKGVIIAFEKQDAMDALKDYFVNDIFGQAGRTLIIESFLKGEEVSILAFTDGKSVRLLTPSQDHKRIFDGDRGPNTGGMGVYTPVKILNSRHIQFIRNSILLPTIKGLASKGITYKGILYVGLMIDGDDINVLEFNCRLGDPEAQCVLPLLKTDLAKIMLSCLEGDLEESDFQIENKAGCTVVIASGGYPKFYNRGFEISGLENIKNANVFHAGTLVERKETGEKIITNGGRVLTVTSYGQNLSEAIQNTYKEVGKIRFKDIFYRKDIGQKGL